MYLNKWNTEAASDDLHACKSVNEKKNRKLHEYRISNHFTRAIVIVRFLRVDKYIYEKDK